MGAWNEIFPKRECNCLNEYIFSGFGTVLIFGKAELTGVRLAELRKFRKALLWTIDIDCPEQ